MWAVWLVSDELEVKVDFASTPARHIRYFHYEGTLIGRLRLRLDNRPLC